MPDQDIRAAFYDLMSRQHIEVKRMHSGKPGRNGKNLITDIKLRYMGKEVGSMTVKGEQVIGCHVDRAFYESQAAAANENEGVLRVIEKQGDRIVLR